MEFLQLDFWEILFPAMIVALGALLLGGLRLGKSFQDREEARRIQSYLEKRVRVVDDSGNETMRRINVAPKRSGGSKT